MKKRWIALIVLLLIIVGGFAISQKFCFPSEDNAKKRVLEFAALVDYHFDNPGKIYDYMTEEYRSSISRSEFVKAFNKERSYPYLTPFFINYLDIEMAEDGLSGVAVFSQAARLPGMTYKLPFRYENGNYYVIAYTDFPDGSYLEKFNSIPHYLTDGWDLE